MPKPPRHSSLTPDRETAGAVLLVVDMISDWRFPDAERLLPQALKCARAIAPLAARFRRAGLPVIYANDNRGRWRSDFREVVAASMEAGGDARRITEALSPEPDDYFVLKPKHSAFFETALPLLLQHLQVQRLYLAGVAADQCIVATAYGARMRDYEVVVPGDCVASQSAARTRRALAFIEEALCLDVRPAARQRLPRG